MSYSLEDAIRLVPGVGQVTEEALGRLGIFKIKDLLTWYPRAYLDASQPIPIAELPLKRLVSISVTVRSLVDRRSKSRGVPLLEALCFDQSGEITIRWFHQAFLKQKLRPGSKWILIGVADRFQGQLQMVSPIIEEVPHILAIYGQTKGITSKMLRSYVGWVLKRVTLPEETLPASVVQQEKLLSWISAMQSIHQPKVMTELDAAKQRLAFEEVFWFFIRMASIQKQNQTEAGIIIPTNLEFLQEIVAKLPFTLTAGQKRVVWDSLKDMATGLPMTRLLNGDVGSGKTVVAALIAAVTAKAGWQTVLLVPTEILAKQHLISLEKLLNGTGLCLALWTAAQKDEMRNSDIVVGTHAVLQEQFSLPRLGLVIIDEQHRFGVQQRQLLRTQQKKVPHVLSMTATPIPRTLALALYGDLAVSILKEKPQDRLPIVTKIILASQRLSLHQCILKELQTGHQVFVICPLIEEKKGKEEEKELQLFEVMTEQERGVEEKKTVLAEVARLKKEHPEYGVIEAVHGKMKAEEKRAVMQRMLDKEINLLVATSVIEVGVDIPNATVMVIEGAERFGLAQLHQFRGRVGRGKEQAYCFLCPSLYSPLIDQRLQVLVNSSSGFEVAEQDLQLRGPGELVGKVQSGLPDFRMASLTDLSFLQKVKQAVEEYLEKDPDYIQKFSEVAYSKMKGSLE